jgi:hypothetical protein
LYCLTPEAFASVNTSISSIVSVISFMFSPPCF